MMNNKQITIAWLYPNLMSIYGDYGNVLTLKRRLEWRGYDVSILEIDFENTKELKKADIILMGGGQDRQQAICVKDMIDNKKPYLAEAHENQTPALFACGGYQLMGHFYHPLTEDEINHFDPIAFSKHIAAYDFVPGEGADLPGLSIFNQYTIHFGNHKPRCIGNIVTSIHNQLKKEISSIYQKNNKSINQFRNITSLVGFENHGGRTYFMRSKNQRIKESIKNTIPLGKVMKGWGNNGEDEIEGIVSQNFIGTYLHGFLMKNPHIADWLISKALKKKYQIETLEPLDDTLEWQTHKRFIKKVL